MNKLKLTLLAIGCLTIATQLALYLRFPVERPARYRSGWSEQNFDAHLNANEKTPLYGKPNQNGLRDGLAMYLPAGDWDLYVHLEYEGEVLFMFDFGRARQFNSIGSLLKSNAPRGLTSGAKFWFRPEAPRRL